MDQNHILKQVSRIVDDLVATCDPSYEVAVIMVAAMFVGPNVDAIVDLTASDRDLIENVASRMRASFMWTDEGVDYENWFSGDAVREIAGFTINLGVAEGLFIRTREKTSTGEWIYQCVDPQVSQN